MDASPLANSSRRGWPLLFLLCSLFLIASGLQAAPFVPDDDAMVLEQVPNARATRELEPLRRRVAENPEDLASVTALASGYLEIGRATADPRYLSYAQASLTGWLQRPNPPPAVLVLAATTEQSLHRFGAALELLDRALQADPANSQAWLTKATILQVTGEFAAARAACGPLLRTAGQLVAVTCLASVNSMTGRLAESYATLASVFVDDDRLPQALRTWILGQLGDMAERKGDRVAAERHFQAALRIDPSDVYVKAAYADLLLQQSRYDAVLALLRGDEALDNLLLRLAIAGQRFDGLKGNEWAALFEARYEAARRDGDFTHLREQARFLLEVKRQPREALRLAEQNWQVQREPADIRLYAEAATASSDAQALEPLKAWLQESRYEDRALKFLQPAADRGRL